MKLIVFLYLPVRGAGRWTWSGRESGAAVLPPPSERWKNTDQSNLFFVWATGYCFVNISSGSILIIFFTHTITHKHTHTHVRRHRYAQRHKIYIYRLYYITYFEQPFIPYVFFHFLTLSLLNCSSDYRLSTCYSFLPRNALAL